MHREALEDDTAQRTHPHLKRSCPDPPTWNTCARCETCVKDNMFMIAGEITAAGKFQHETVARGAAYRQVHMNHMVQKTMDILQLRQTEKVIDVPVLVMEVSWVCFVADTAEIPVTIGDARCYTIGIVSFIDNLTSVGGQGPNCQDCEASRAGACSSCNTRIATNSNPQDK